MDNSISIPNGTLLQNRYEIKDKIGAGGMSDVYLAHDTALNRQVAVKVLKTEFAEDKSFVTKFRAEAQSAANLEHPNIVSIYDVGSEGALYYIVMEYVEGITLKTYISKKERLTYNEALSIAIQVGRGIESAHNKGIVHRDIKPQNIIISKEGNVKVMDFGIARAASSNTISAELMGSVHYASPEQARSGYVTFTSDIYSLGIVMYEMVTGRVPYDGDTAVSIAIQHIQGEMVPPSAYAPDLPTAVERIIQKATMKSQDRRYQTMSDMLVDLKKALISPDDDFVIIPEAENPGLSDTKIITEEELREIQEKTSGAMENNMSPRSQGSGNGKNKGKNKNGQNNKNRQSDGEKAAIAAAAIGAGAAAGLAGSEAKAKASGMPGSNGRGDFSNREESLSQKQSGKSYPDRSYEDDYSSEKLKASSRKKKDMDLDDDDEADNPKLDKIMTLLGIAAAVVIAVIVLVLLVQVLGPKGGEKAKQSSSAGSSTVSSSETASSSKSSSAASSQDDPDEVKVPSLLGKTVNEVKKVLSDLHLGFKDGGETSSDKYEKGKACAQSPNDGVTVKRNSQVTVIFSSGIGDVEVPSVKGYDEANAIKTLEDAGFKYSRTYSYSSTVPQGKVISQRPSNKAKKGDVITLEISQGVETIKVPSLKGLTVDEAKKTLEDKGLTLGEQTSEYSDTVEAGMIISHAPAANAYANAGDSVSVVVSKGKEEVLYSFSRTISAIDGVKTVYTLTDANGDTLGTWTVNDGDSETISVSGIKTENGMLSWKTVPPSEPPSSSGSSSGEPVTPITPKTGAEGVTFTKQ